MRVGLFILLNFLHKSVEVLYPSITTLFLQNKVTTLCFNLVVICEESIQFFLAMTMRNSFL